MAQAIISTNDTSSGRESTLDTLKIHTDDLLQGNRCLVLQHGESEYLLTVTRSNKLILTK